MVTVDVDGTRYPCHRFLPLCTGKPLPDGPVNRQTRWKPEKCAKCNLAPSCPTCIGFNYQLNGDTAKRTTHHCEAFKLGIMASCKLEAIRWRLKICDIGQVPARLSQDERLIGYRSEYIRQLKIK
ncbi:MAG: hypothetical protein NT166_01540 [Candidatus Aminicenantes bacterium]|nr:hypothetical protein [Candidatus Aminicenantes bacterium]